VGLLQSQELLGSAFFFFLSVRVKYLLIYLFLFIYSHVHTLFGSFLHPGLGLTSVFSAGASQADAASPSEGGGEELDGGGKDGYSGLQ
jgi:hypothetical protein